MTTDTAAAARFGEVVRRLADRADPPIEQARGFGAAALKHNGRIFAMLHDGRLVVKLTAARVAELSAAGQGTPFHGSGGRPMREWVAIAMAAQDQWLVLAEAALTLMMARQGEVR